MVNTLLRRLICSAILGLCTMLTMCFGATDAEKTGVGIFDTLFIANHSALSIHGDLYLEHAHVLGQGSLVVHVEKKSRIVSDHSEVSNLKVITYGKVRLEGELEVTQSLTVQTGVLDVSAGRLHLTDSMEIRLLNGAQIQYDLTVSDVPIKSGLRLTAGFAAKAILTSSLRANKALSCKVQQQYQQPAGSAQQINRNVHSAPPEKSSVQAKSH